MSILDVMGPVMIGPSSSHTAGAAKVGYLARQIYGRPWSAVEVVLYNSLAETGKGHGTDNAVVGGLLGMAVDDERLKDALRLAAEQGLRVVVHRQTDPEKHPNCVRITFHAPAGEASGGAASSSAEPPRGFSVTGVSLGGGRVSIVDIDGLAVRFSGKYDVLLLTYLDVPGMVGFIGEVLGARQINIAYLQISRDAESGKATAFLKLDAPCTPQVLAELRQDPRVMTVTYVSKLGEEYGGAEED